MVRPERARRAGFTGPGGATSLPLTGTNEFEAETQLPMLGLSVQVLLPGGAEPHVPLGDEQEDFFVLSGDALLVVEGRSVLSDSGTSCTARRRRDTSSSVRATGRA
jgi:hypothetical protein